MTCLPASSFTSLSLISGLLPKSRPSPKRAQPLRPLVSSSKIPRRHASDTSTQLHPKHKLHAHLSKRDSARQHHQPPPQARQRRRAAAGQCAAAIMSDRPSHRGGRGGDRGAHRGRGGAAGGRGGSSNAQGERPKKENILDLAKYMDKEIIVKFNGGREGRNRPHAQRERRWMDGDIGGEIRWQREWYHGRKTDLG